MREHFSFGPQDRVLVFAPHPDDEVLGSSGLILHARACGAQVRVVFITNGDNNPWPQRYIERRLRIGAAERRRWGERRQQEAARACQTLGLSSEQYAFISLPDQGLTRLLVAADDATISLLAKALADYSPTVIVAPSCVDVHPDHNAFFVLLQIARLRVASAQTAREYYYAVHQDEALIAQFPFALVCSEEERRVRRRALAQHVSQLVLSKRRFLRCLTDVEHYHELPLPPVLVAAHPLRRARVDGTDLRLDIARHFCLQEHCGVKVYVVTVNAAGALRTREIALRAAGAKLNNFELRKFPAHTECVLRGLIEPAQKKVFIKVQYRSLFFDLAGWLPCS